MAIFRKGNPLRTLKGQQYSSFGSGGGGLEITLKANNTDIDSASSGQFQTPISADIESGDSVISLLSMSKNGTGTYHAGIHKRKIGDKYFGANSTSITNRSITGGLGYNYAKGILLLTDGSDFFGGCYDTILKYDSNISHSDSKKISSGTAINIKGICYYNNNIFGVYNKVASDYRTGIFKIDTSTLSTISGVYSTHAEIVGDGSNNLSIEQSGNNIFLISWKSVQGLSIIKFNESLSVQAQTRITTPALYIGGTCNDGTYIYVIMNTYVLKIRMSDLVVVASISLSGQSIINYANKIAFGDDVICIASPSLSPRCINLLFLNKDLGYIASKNILVSAEYGNQYGVQMTYNQLTKNFTLSVVGIGGSNSQVFIFGKNITNGISIINSSFATEVTNNTSWVITDYLSSVVTTTSNATFTNDSLTLVDTSESSGVANFATGVSLITKS